jgi:hypothetical protein
MKANRAKFHQASAACAALSLLVGACVAPTPAPVAAPSAQPSPPPPPPSVASDWHDAPATPGEWQWSSQGSLSIARFGGPGQPPLLSLSCDPQAATIKLSREGDQAGAATTLSISTTSLSRTLPIRPGADPAIVLPALDPLLDAIAFSRGRFAVEVPGMAPLYLPSWPEVGRVIEDCRSMR